MFLVIPRKRVAKTGKARRHRFSHRTVRKRVERERLLLGKGRKEEIKSRQAQKIKQEQVSETKRKGHQDSFLSKVKKKNSKSLNGEKKKERRSPNKKNPVTQ